MAIDPELDRFLEDAPLFMQPWWLEAVSPGKWDYAVTRRGEAVAGVIPFAFKIRLGLRLIEMPPLTPYLGPWLRPSTAKYANRLSEEKDLMTELIEALPPFAVFNQCFHPAVANWLPFYWKGFHQTTLYTYRIEPASESTTLWKEMRDNVRTDIKKAEKQVVIRQTDDVSDFLQVHRLTFSRQNKKMPHSEEVVRRVDTACAQRGARRILLAQDNSGRTHAAIYLVTDQKTVFYLLGGGDPKLRNSGATSLLIWEAIRWASEQGKEFDFEGSIVESIERFVRSFGARQSPFFSVGKNRSHTITIYRALRKMASPRVIR